MNTKWEEECTTTSYPFFYYYFIYFYFYIFSPYNFIFYPVYDYKSNAGKECVVENDIQGKMQTRAIGPLNTK